MVKKMFTSLLVCLLVPTCMTVYFFLFQAIKDKGLWPFEESEVVAQEETGTVLADSELPEVEADEEIEEAQEEEAIPEPAAVPDNSIDPALLEQLGLAAVGEEAEPEEEADSEPMDEIDYTAVRNETQQLSHEETPEGVRVRFVTRDVDGNIIEERYETLDNSQVIQPNSDRHLEILAQEFVRMHFDYAGMDVFYSGELLYRDNEYAKVAVTKTEWKVNFYKEKYNVIIELNHGQPKPVSMQQVRNAS